MSSPTLALFVRALRLVVQQLVALGRRCHYCRPRSRSGGILCASMLPIFLGGTSFPLLVNYHMEDLLFGCNAASRLNIFRESPSVSTWPKKRLWSTTNALMLSSPDKHCFDTTWSMMFLAKLCGLAFRHFNSLTAPAPVTK